MNLCHQQSDEFAKFYCLRSFIYSKNGGGPRTDPCGVPQFLVVRPESKTIYGYILITTRQIGFNHLKLHESHIDPILLTVSGGQLYQKLFVSLQKLHNLYFHNQELFLYSQFD